MVIKIDVQVFDVDAAYINATRVDMVCHYRHHLRAIETE